MIEINDLLELHPFVHFAYEAAVCGGIPIIHTLQTTYLTDKIHQVRPTSTLFFSLKLSFRFKEL